MPFIFDSKIISIVLYGMMMVHLTDKFVIMKHSDMNVASLVSRVRYRIFFGFVCRRSENVQ